MVTVIIIRRTPRTFQIMPHPSSSLRPSTSVPNLIWKFSLPSLWLFLKMMKPTKIGKRNPVKKMKKELMVLMVEPTVENESYRGHYSNALT